MRRMPKQQKKLPPQERIKLLPSAINHPPPKIYNNSQGLRIVEPYYHIFQTFAKERWLGRELLEVVSLEFRDRSRSYYKWAIESGVATINRVRAKPNSILRNGDLIENTVHAHEPPVVAELPHIIYKDNDKGWLVISKPGSIPVHAAGRYRKNTLLEILKDEYGLSGLYCCNRLDRLTSGVMVIGTKKEAGQLLGEAFMKGTIRKEYLAKCHGKLPDGKIIVNEPIITVDRQMGLVIRHPEGKPAQTIFERMSYDENTNTSIVYCQPLTGRTHQIRVHLQYLGHAIANDPLYASYDVWGYKRGKGGLPTYTTSKVLSELQQLDKEYEKNKKNIEENIQVEKSKKVILDNSLSDESRKQITNIEDIGFNSPVELSNDHKEVIKRLRAQKDESDGWSRWRDAIGFEKDLSKERKEDSEEINDREDYENLKSVTNGLGGYCPTCHIPLIENPKLEDLFIYLHATRYTTTEWCFEAPLPNWIDDEGAKWWNANNLNRKQDLINALENRT